MPFRRQLAAALIAGCASTAALAQSGQGWIVDFTWQYEAQANRALRGGSTGPGGADTLVSAASDIRIMAQARGSMHFSGKLRGAAAVNMPDSRNEQRYDSWRGYGGRPAFASIDIVVQYEEAARINKADGEGADRINAERKGIIGRVQHQRYRYEVKASGDDIGWLGEHADLQIDRVANKLMIVNRIDLQANRKTVRPSLSYVKRQDKAAASGEWDRSGPDEGAWRGLPHFAPRNEIVLDIPPGADQFTVTRTYETADMPDPHELIGSAIHSDMRSDVKAGDKKYQGRGTLTLTARRVQADAAAAAAPKAATPAAAPATAPAPASRETTTQKSEPAKAPQPSAAEEALDAVKKLRGLFGR